MALGGAAFGALAALNSALSETPRPPRQHTPGRQARYDWALGTVRYTVNGSGPTLLLVHGIGLTTSSFEMRYVAEALADAFTVYIVDLLGFGLSDRPRIMYSADMYIRLLADFLRDVVGADARVIACGLSGSYVLTVAADQPALVRSLLISSPADIGGGGAHSTAHRQAAGALLGVPLAGQTVFNGMTTRSAIRTFLREQAYSNADLVTEYMVDAMYTMAHQPNARYAAGAFLSGALDHDASEALKTLRRPLLLVFGDRAAGPPRAIAAAFVRLAPRTQVLILERCGMLPHEEQAGTFVDTANAWLQT